MRFVEVIAFYLALVALIAALITAGTTLGDIFWRAGVAVLMVDIVMMMLWPPARTTAE